MELRWYGKKALFLIFRVYMGIWCMGEYLNLTISPFLINFFSFFQIRNSVITVAGIVMKRCVNYFIV